MEYSVKFNAAFEPSHSQNYIVHAAFRVGEITVEKGFVFDGASAPNYTLNMLGLSRFDPRLIIAACVHDKAYRTGIVKKPRADQIFFNLLIQGGISKTKAKILYNSVRFFGGKYYNPKK